MYKQPKINCTSVSNLTASPVKFCRSDGFCLVSTASLLWKIKSWVNCLIPFSSYKHIFFFLQAQDLSRKNWFMLEKMWSVNLAIYKKFMGSRIISTFMKEHFWSDLQSTPNTFLVTEGLNLSARYNLFFKVFNVQVMAIYRPFTSIYFFLAYFQNTINKTCWIDFFFFHCK